MCGIGGIAAPGVEEAPLAAMAAAMGHRGPDGEGTWRAEGIGFAHRRLAIIDLDHRSDQPMREGPLHLVFNGEIYNYRELRADLEREGRRFRTEGDTEVLLQAWAAWGEGALDRLNGMFAFAVWDERDRSLTLARDAFGEKPLFVAHAGGRLAFASDVRALRAAGVLPAPDLGAAAAFLAWGLMPAPERSFFAGLGQLPAAHLLRWRDGRAQTRRWWSPGPVAVPASFEDQAQALGALLADAVRLRLRSDVPVGSSLSGGVDSSAIVALAGDLAADHARHAFTCAFPGFERDELRYARASAERAGVREHHVVEPVAAELLEDLGRLALDQGEPYGTTSIYAQWRVMRLAAEAGVTVLLDGQGADELLAGYPGAAGYALLSQGPRAALGALGRAGDRGAVAAAAAVLAAPPALGRARRRRAFAPYAAPAAARAAVGRPWPRAARSWGDPLRAELLLQVRETSLPALLRYADRNSMAHSREVRLPFLDRRLAEFALSLPADALLRGGVAKAVLRRAVRGRVPDLVLDRTEKVGFEAPQERWLREPAVRARIAEALLDPAARARGLYDTRAVERDVARGAWSDPAAIWRALSTELWLRAFS